MPLDFPDGAGVLQVTDCQHHGVLIRQADFLIGETHPLEHVAHFHELILGILGLNDHHSQGPIEQEKQPVASYCKANRKLGDEGRFSYIALPDQHHKATDLKEALANVILRSVNLSPAIRDP